VHPPKSIHRLPIRAPPFPQAEKRHHYYYLGRIEEVVVAVVDYSCFMVIILPMIESCAMM
jgi:hypothetical protein